MRFARLLTFSIFTVSAIFSLSARATEVVQVDQSTTLFEKADLNSNQYTIVPGQQILITDTPNSDFSRTSLLSPEGDVQLVGYIEKTKRPTSKHVKQVDPRAGHLEDLAKCNALGIRVTAWCHDYLYGKSTINYGQSQTDTKRDYTITSGYRRNGTQAIPFVLTP